MLETIRQRVQTAVNNSTKQIIVGVYQNMIASHNEFCDCNYCTVLKEYVRMKRYKASTSKRLRMLGIDYGYWNADIEEDMFSDIRKVNSKIKELKIYKDSLKVL